MKIKNKIIQERLLQKGLSNRDVNYLRACDNLGREPEEDPYLYEKLKVDQLYDLGKIKFKFDGPKY
ncbi:MAG: hypothetical protein QT05_C0048G0032 [archaeon GW2011_AR13]|nr:MAG: hypothetical protein QT05_C0048G0032 [archaeon GW2011_AR13]HIG94115.1 hypothetical protein [Nanoarchaeota archaeon]HIH63956.1 hypothetical protein [Nanoarchaeota archaeon]HIJ09702.1 hypothetical protein [Nanoarchaeota archaeon]